MSWATTPNMGFKYHINSSSDTSAFDLDNALNYNWTKIDGYNPDSRLTALEERPKCNGRIYQTQYQGTGTTDFTIDIQAGNISNPSMAILYSLDATIRQNSLVLLPDETGAYKCFDFNYDDASDLYPPISEFGNYSIRLYADPRSSEANPSKLMNEESKWYSIIVIGQT